MGSCFIVNKNYGNGNSITLNKITDFYATGNDGNGILNVVSENGFIELPNIIILHANYCALYVNNNSSEESSLCLYLEYNKSSSKYNGTAYFGWGSLSSYHNITNDLLYTPNLAGEILILTPRSYDFPKVRTTRDPKGTIGWYI